jgi:hypothetical protein
MSLKDAVGQFVPASGGGFLGDRRVFKDGIHAKIVAGFSLAGHCWDSIVRKFSSTLLRKPLRGVQ